MKKIAMMITGVFFACLMAGCGTNYPAVHDKIEAEQEIARQFLERYHLEIAWTVHSLVELDQHYWEAEPEEAELSYEAYLPENGGVLLDTYARSLYGAEISNLLDTELTPYADQLTSYEMVYLPTQKAWKEDGDIREYLKKSSSYVTMQIDFSDAEKEEAAQRLYELAKEMKNDGFQFMIHMRWKDVLVIDIENNDTHMLRIKEIRDFLS